MRNHLQRRCVSSTPSFFPPPPPPSTDPDHPPNNPQSQTLRTPPESQQHHPRRRQHAGISREIGQRHQRHGHSDQEAPWRREAQEGRVGGLAEEGEGDEEGGCDVRGRSGEEGV